MMADSNHTVEETIQELNHSVNHKLESGLCDLQLEENQPACTQDTSASANTKLPKHLSNQVLPEEDKIELVSVTMT